MNEKTGKLSKLRRCPDCHVEMHSRSLTAGNTIKGLVAFIQSSSSYPTTRAKIKWSKIRFRLMERRLASRFWDAWAERRWLLMKDEDKSGFEYKDYLDYFRNKSKYENWDDYKYIKYSGQARGQQ